jgi:hypothetical protein
MLTAGAWNGAEGEPRAQAPSPNHQMLPKTQRHENLKGGAAIRKGTLTRVGIQLQMPVGRGDQ